MRRRTKNEGVDSRSLAPWGDAVVGQRLGGGNRNDVWSARVHGRRCVARRTSRSVEALDWELSLLSFLEAEDLKVPAFVPTVDGRRHANGIAVFEWVDGSAPAAASEWTRVARYLQRLHELTLGWPQRPGFLSASELIHAHRGGDVDLAEMPDDAVAACRKAWESIQDHPRAVVHGDPGASNVMIADGHVVLIDWDEARVDAPAFDLAALPDAASPLETDERVMAHRAASAWEAAVSWTHEPAYARRRLAELG